jgi:hypothetical protein
MEARIRSRTACSCIRPATNRFTAKVWTWVSRVPRGAFERLELHEWKHSRAVLRGGGDGDVTSLPDVRHEATDGPVMTGLLGHNPVCDHRYPTRTCRRSNPAVRSSWDNVTSPRWGGRSSREGIRRLLTPRRSGARVDGRANSGELLINVVRSSKPKALIGLNQTVRGQVQGPLPSPAVAVRATGEEAEPAPSVIRPWNVVSPSSSPRGRPAARWSPMGRRVKDEGRSECRPVTGRIGVESSGEITPRESGPTSLGSFVTRAPGNPLRGASR